MLKISFTPIFLAIFMLFFTSLEGQTKRKLANPFENEGNLNLRFEYLYKTSTNYKEYKVISKNGYSTLHKNVLDTLSYLKTETTKQQNLNKKQAEEIKSLQVALAEKTDELAAVTANKNAIEVFGTAIHKTNYNLMVVFIIVALLLIGGFYFYKYSNSHIETKEARELLEETQQEYEDFQKKALKRQQVLNRKLQDEIIKNRKE